MSYQTPMSSMFGTAVVGVVQSAAVAAVWSNSNPAHVANRAIPSSTLKGAPGDVVFNFHLFLDPHLEQDEMLAHAKVFHSHSLQESAAEIVQLGLMPRIGTDVVTQFYQPRFTADEMEQLVIPRRTLARRIKAEEPLSEDETNRALRLDRVVTEADRVFGDSEKADRWLRKPHRRFNTQSPLTMIRSEAGSQAVEELLGQIDHGLFA
jgi:putative toxin-antitoxin system antitoxin component (TIGR02293 family)